MLLKQIYASLRASSQPDEVCAMEKCKTAPEVPGLDAPLWWEWKVTAGKGRRSNLGTRSDPGCSVLVGGPAHLGFVCSSASLLLNFPFSASLWVVSIPVVVFLFGTRSMVLCWPSPTDFALSSLQHLMLGWTRTPASACAFTLPSPPSGALLPWSSLGLG